MSTRASGRERKEPEPRRAADTAGPAPAGPRSQVDAKILPGDDRFHLVFDNARIGVAIVGLDGTFLSVNPSACRTLGCGPEEIVGRTFASITHPDDLDASLRLFQGLVAGEYESYELEKRFIRKGGHTVFVEITVSLAHDAGGRPRYVLGQVQDVTERRRIAEELRASEARLRGIFEASADIISLVDLEGRIVDANRETARLFGYESVAELERTATRVFDLFPPGENDRAKAMFDRVLREGTVRDIEHRVVRPDGTFAEIEVNLAVLPDAAGRPAGVTAVARDITARKRTEAALRENEETHRSLFENMLNGFAYCRMLFDRGRPVDFVYLDVNRAFEAQTGLKNVVGKRVSEVIPGIRETDPEIFEVYGRVALTGKPERFETYIEALGMWFDVSVYSPRLEHFAAVFDVVTERKRAAEALAASEEKYRSVFENAAEGIVIAKDGMLLMANPAALRMTGRSGTELLSKPFVEFIHPDDRETVGRNHRARLAGRDAPEVYEFRLLRPDGALRWVEIRAVPISWEGERATLNFLTDVTERHRAEDERERLATAIEQAAETIVMTDTEGTIEYVNPAFTRITAYTREEAIGRNPSMLKSGAQDTEFYRRLWQTIKRGETWSGRFRNKRKDGTIFEEEATISPIRDKSGRVHHFVAVKRDVTEIVRLESELRQSQKMEAVGTLAGGIAHDFNNILYSMLGFTDLAMDGLQPGGRERRCLEEVRRAGDRGIELIGQILAFSRRNEVKRGPLRLDRAVEDGLRILERACPRGVRMRVRLDKIRGEAIADKTEIQQVLLNLCTNGFHAMEGSGGVLEVALRERIVGKEIAPPSPNLTAGRYAVLTVTDTGHGMDESTVRRIFEPYFTRKPVGEGTGVGLSTVHGIVQAMGGAVLVESAPGRGSRFDVYFPLPERRPPIGPAEETPEKEVSDGADSRRGR